MLPSDVARTIEFFASDDCVSGIPWTVVRATQFHELAESITESLTADTQVRAGDEVVAPLVRASWVAVPWMLDKTHGDHDMVWATVNC